MIITEILGAFIASITFGILFNVKGWSLFHSGIAGAISWFSYLLGRKYGLSDGANYFIATFLLTTYVKIISIKNKIPVIAVLIPALIPLAPGSGVYYTMYNLIEEHYLLALEKGISTCVIAGAMAIGAFIPTNIERVLKR